jgi:NodT family efflux transporter outer membrane factor (OMF) lipoprotein
VELSASWSEPLPSGLADAAAKEDGWWSDLRDPLLDELIEHVLAGSLEVTELLARIRESRAIVDQVDAARRPNVALTADSQRDQSSEAFGSGGQTERAQVGLRVSWEPDVFGRLALRTDAAQADLEARVHDANALVVAILADTAKEYIQWRTVQARLAVVQRSLENQRGTLDLAQARFEAGQSDEFDAVRARSTLAETQARIPALELEATQTRHRLLQLAGSTPTRPTTAQFAALSTPAPIPAPPREIAVGVPAELLLNRPDIRRAERELAAQAARAGVAEAELLPSMTMSGFLGLSAGRPDALFDAANLTWSLVNSLSWQVFDRGVLTGRSAAERARLEQALARFESTVLNAATEVESALAALGRNREREALLSQAVEAASESVRFAQWRYEEGVVNFQDVLDAQRTMLAFEDQLATARGQLSRDYVELCRSLGTGRRLNVSSDDLAKRE